MTSLDSEITTKNVDLQPANFVDTWLFPRPTHILIVLHGIRDNGYWANTLQQELDAASEGSVRIIPIRYTFVNEVEFLFRRILLAAAWETHAKLTEEFESDNFKDIPKSILCHSNGTKVLALILRTSLYRFQYIFLAGSICHRREAATFARAAVGHPINFIGVRDRWSILAEAIDSSANEATGVWGFDGGQVRNLAFDFGHNGGIQSSHIRKYVLPILEKSYPKIPSPPSPRFGPRSVVWHRWALYAALPLLGAVIWGLYAALPLLGTGIGALYTIAKLYLFAVAKLIH